MKKSLKTLAVFLMIALLITSVTSGCKMSFDEEETESEEVKQESKVESLSTRRAKVSIIQYINYTALNECCEGIKQSLEAANIEYEVNVGSDSSPEQDCEEFAQNTAINGGYDLVITIGTPASIAAYPSISSSSKVPVIFCAVTDPVGANLVVSNQTPTNNCTGISTAFNITEQLNMINTFQPTITKLGVIYTKDEPNTEQQLKTLKSEAKKLNITIYEGAAESVSDLKTLAAEMVPEVDAITLLPDNMVSANSWEIMNQAIIGNKPVYGVTQTEVKEGCLAGYCYDFTELGRKTGERAAAVLRGQSAADTPVELVSDCTLYVNTDAVESLSIDIPDSYSNAQKVKTSYE